MTQNNVPADSLLRTFRGGARPTAWGSYQDCFSLRIDGVVHLEQFVFAFYTSPLFRLERFILRLAVANPSTDADARAVAAGSALQFAAWYVGERTSNQLLMCDRFEHTRSWFQVSPLKEGRTLLQFGSAVAAAPNRSGGKAEMSRSFRLLLGFHVWYSQVLLRSAYWQLKRLKDS